jgi:hypothetical protein
MVAPSVLMGRSQSVPEMRTTLTEGVEESLGPMGSTQIVPGTILTTTEAADLPEKTSPEFALVLEVAQSQPASLIAPETRLTLSEGVEVSQIPMDPTQTAPELAQTAPVLVLPELPGIVDVGEGSASSAIVLPVPKAQLSVHGLTEAQTWFLGWLRDGTRNHNLLGAIDCFEVGTRRSNEVAPPPVCPIELPKLKAKLRDRGRRQGECGSKLGSFYGGKTRGLLRLGEGYFRGSGLRRLGRFCGVCRGCVGFAGVVWSVLMGFFVGCCLGLLLLVLWVLLMSLGRLLGAFRRS